MIYTNLLISATPIAIVSPRGHGHKCPEYQLIPAQFAALTRVSKQVRGETVSFFYGRNTFLVSNGDYASSHSPNIHSLKSFVSRCPAPHLI
jgi:hypothetical protein